MPIMRIGHSIMLLFMTARLGAEEPRVIPINGQGEGRVFEGICGVNAGGGVGRLLINYPEPQRSEILDFLFKPNYGAAFQAYKAEIGGDGNSTEGAEPSHMHTADDQNYNRGYQWWMMEEAKKRNPKIKLLALAWDFPAWVKTVDSQACADYLVNYVRGAKSVHNLDIDYLGLWNETKVPMSFIKRLRKTLDASGLQQVKIVGDDYVNDWTIVDQINQDKELFDALDVVTTHYPKYESTAAAKACKKPIWSSEDGPWSDTWACSGQMSGPLARLLNLNYAKGRMTSTHIWNVVTAYYDILDCPNAGQMRAFTPWSGHYEVISPLWVVAHTTQFAQPGWQYLDDACGVLKQGGSFVTLKHGADFSLISETLDALEKQTIVCRLSKGISTNKVSVWRTDATNFFEKIDEIIPTNGAFSVTLNPDCVYSLTTTTGQGKGVTRPPADKPFPFPYQDDFERYAEGTTCVNYFIEQNGAYEVVPASHGRSGKALRQVVSHSPVVWGTYEDANKLGTACIMGDKKWSNYAVSSDVLLEEPGYARVMGRVSRVTLGGQIAGYQLYYYDSGEWKLNYATTEGTLASGKTEGNLNTWHNLKLSFSGDEISAIIDGKQVAKVTDNKFACGIAGIGNDYNLGLYDNFAITSVGPAVNVYAAQSENRFFFDKAPETPPLHLCQPRKNAIRLSWDAVEGARGYKLRYGIREDELKSVVEVGNLTSYTVWTLTSGQKYFFAVSAYNEKGDSAPSGIESASAQ